MIWKDWGDESVVFDSRSGETHLLDLPTREALRCFELEAHDHPGLSKALAARLEIDVDAELEHYVTQLITRLDSLGLIDLAP